jgi:hypothetical protein
MEFFNLNLFPKEKRRGCGGGRVRKREKLLEEASPPHDLIHHCVSSCDSLLAKVRKR